MIPCPDVYGTIAKKRKIDSSLLSNTSLPHIVVALIQKGICPDLGKAEEVRKAGELTRLVLSSDLCHLELPFVLGLDRKADGVLKKVDHSLACLCGALKVPGCPNIMSSQFGLKSNNVRRYLHVTGS